MKYIVLMIKKGSLYAIVWIIWAFFFYCIIATSLPNSVSPIADKVKEFIRITLPQGWAFFTKTPRESMMDIYFINENQLRLINYSNVNSKNLFGFSRSSRYISFELSKILAKVPKGTWEDGIGDIKKNIPIESEVIHLYYKFKYFKKGEYIIIQYKQIPWAWAKNSQEKNRPYLIKRILLI